MSDSRGPPLKQTVVGGSQASSNGSNTPVQAVGTNISTTTNTNVNANTNMNIPSTSIEPAVSNSFVFSKVFKNIAKSFKTAQASIGSPQLRPAIAGAASDLEDLLGKIADSSSSASDKIKAAELLRASLEMNAISSIPEIWYTVKLLLDNDVPECRRAGLRLMNTCLNQDEDAIGSKLSYYKALISYKHLVDFDLMINALRTLTQDGRDLYDIHQSGFSLPKTMTGWLRVLAKNTLEIRDVQKRDPCLVWGGSTESNMHSLLDYIIKTLEFNMSIYTEVTLEKLLHEVAYLASKTSSEVDLIYCCDLIIVVMKYGFIPVKSLGSIIEILCGIYTLGDDLSEKSWTAISNLANSHLGNSTVLTLCGFIDVKDKNAREINSSTMRGATNFLKNLIVNFGNPDTGEVVNVPISAIFASYMRSLSIASVRLRLQMCDDILDIIKNDKTRALISYEIWEITAFSPLEIIYRILQSFLVVGGGSNNNNNNSALSSRGSIRAFSAFGSITQSITDTLKMTSAATVSSSSSSSNHNTVSQSQLNDLVVKIKSLVITLTDLLASKKFNGSEEVVMRFLVDMSDFLDPTTALLVINYYDSMHYCSPITHDWERNIDTILKNYLYNQTWVPEVRIRLLENMQNMFLLTLQTSDSQIVGLLLDKLFASIEDEQNLDVFAKMLEVYSLAAAECDHLLFIHLNDMFMKIIPDGRAAASIKNTDDRKISSEKSRMVTRIMASLFMKFLKRSGRRARYMYFNLVTIAQRSIGAPTVFIEAARLLIRIRCTASGLIYVTHPTDIDGLSHCMGRVSPFKRSPEYLWWYPENEKDLDYLDNSQLLDSPSPIVMVSTYYDVIDDPSVKDFSSHILRDDEYDLDVDIWLSLIVDIIEAGAHWEIYSYVWAHFANQLSNLQLFYGSPGNIQRFRRVLSEQIMSSKVPGAVKIPNDITKLDIMVANIRTISSLVGYKYMFAKSECDFLVQALVSALSSWEKTAVPCISALIICCYEMSLSVKKHIGAIFSKFQTKITSVQSSPHVLEFLLSLARLPWITDNMTQEEYRRIFAMAFTYIQHANDMDKKAGAVETNDIISQYLLALAYNVIACWFVVLPLPRRRDMATYITRNLILADGKLDAIDEQSMATLDLISRFTYSDVDLVQQSGFMPIKDANVSVKRWLFGKSVISIETNGFTGESRFIVRRPTGNAIVDFRPDDTMLPKDLLDDIKLSNHVQVVKRKNAESIFSPSYFLLQMVIPNDAASYLRPISLNEEPATIRAVSALDRAPVVDFHKIGVLYIAPGQRTESEILGNSSGSRRYRRFLKSLGKLVRLKGNKQIYSGGLDTEMDIDGKYAYFWSDKFTQMIYHITTMMPPPANPDDSAFSTRKRHIGNDYICIFFDESGHQFDFNVIRTQFTFINIVISPHTINSKTRVGQPTEYNEHVSSSNNAGSEDVQGPNFYKVRAYAKEGIPDVFAALHLKIVSEESLEVFIRNLAIMASKLATIYSSNGRYVSNWRYRLQQINQLQTRVLASSQVGESATLTRESKERSSNSNSGVKKSGDNDYSEIETSFLEQLAAVSGSNNNSNSATEPGSSSASASIRSPGSRPMSGTQDNVNDIELLRKIEFSSYT